MSNVDVSFARAENDVTVFFGEHFAQSEQFDAIFRDGMELVERTASYLDGQGRKESRPLKPPISVVYATESMRLTTRLLELASWLLVQRGLRDGEISREEALQKREQLKLRTFGRSQSIKFFDQLPQGLQDLIGESVGLMERILVIDQGLRAREAPDAASSPGRANPVNSQLAALQAAFSGRNRNQ